MRSTWLRRLAAAMASLALGACQDQVFEPVRDGLVTTASLQGQVNVTTRADLLFVIDDSPSMANEQQKLAAGFPELLQQLEALDPPVDYRVAVMTTSVAERFGSCAPGDAAASSACSAAFGGTGFTCEAGACVRRFPARAGRLVAATNNPAILERSKLAASDLARKFGENVQVGVEGSRHEQPLRAVLIALANGELDAFWRPGARLVVFIASDEDDCSDSSDRFVALLDQGGTRVDACEREARTDSGELDDVAAWVRSLRGARAGAEVAVGAIVGLAAGTQDPGMCVDEGCATTCRGPGHESSCRTGCTGALREDLCVRECMEECVSFCGSQTPGRRLARAARGMSGPVASICESNFGPVLSRLAAVIGIPKRMELPSTPNDGRTFFFLVRRGDATIACREGDDYTLDLAAVPPALDIRQDARCRLLPGDQWTIRYLAK